MRWHRFSVASSLSAGLLSLLLVYISGFWVWPTPLALARDRADLFDVHYGLPLPYISYDLGLDPPYPYPIRAMSPSPWEDTFEILWAGLFVDLIFWFVVSMLLIRLFRKVLQNTTVPATPLLLLLLFVSVFSACGTETDGSAAETRVEEIVTTPKTNKETTEERIRKSASGTVPAMASVEFRRQIAAERAVKLARRSGVRVTTLQSEFEAGGRTQVDNYGVTPEKSPEQIAEDYKRARVGAAIDMENAVRQGTEETQGTQEDLRSDKEIKVYKMELEGDEKRLKQFIRKHEVIISKSSVVTEKDLEKMIERRGELEKAGGQRPVAAPGNN